MTVRQEPERAFARVEGNTTAGRDFVVGDVHGEFETLEAILASVGFLPGCDRLFALGDLIDRGPRSADALAWMETGQIELSVRGNHEQMLLDRTEAAESDREARTRRTAHPLGIAHPWFARDVERTSWAKWKAMIRAMPFGATGGAVQLAGRDGATVAWDPDRLAARAGGVEVYKTQTMELRAGDRIRWTRNDAGLGVVNSQTAEVTAVRNDQVSFRQEDRRVLDMNAGDPQLRHIDRGWASTVHAFQGRTVDRVIAALEANHPNLTNQKMLYVEISRARDRAALVTDDKAALQEQIQALTAERIAALEVVGEEKPKAAELPKSPDGGVERSRERDRTNGRSAEPDNVPEPRLVDRDLGL